MGVQGNLDWLLLSGIGTVLRDRTDLCQHKLPLFKTVLFLKLTGIWYSIVLQAQKGCSVLLVLSSSYNLFPSYAFVH